MSLIFSTVMIYSLRLIQHVTLYSVHKAGKRFVHLCKIHLLVKTKRILLEKDSLVLLEPYSLVLNMFPTKEDETSVIPK